MHISASPHAFLAISALRHHNRANCEQRLLLSDFKSCWGCNFDNAEHLTQVGTDTANRDNDYSCDIFKNDMTIQMTQPQTCAVRQMLT